MKLIISLLAVVFALSVKAQSYTGVPSECGVAVNSQGVVNNTFDCSLNFGTANKVGFPPEVTVFDVLTTAPVHNSGTVSFETFAIVGADYFNFGSISLSTPVWNNVTDPLSGKTFYLPTQLTINMWGGYDPASGIPECSGPPEFTNCWEAFATFHIAYKGQYLRGGGFQLNRKNTAWELTVTKQ